VPDVGSGILEDRLPSFNGLERLALRQFEGWDAVDLLRIENRLDAVN
jgi:hypothetical protein